MRRVFVMLSAVLLLTQGLSATEAEPRFPTCEGELAFAPALYAIQIRPLFSNFAWIRARIEQVREYGQPYLSEKELDHLVAALDDLEDEVGIEYDHRSTIANLLNVAEFNLVHEFRAEVDRVERDLRRKAGLTLASDDLEHHRWLTELLARVEHYRQGISIERGAWYWQHARYEASQSLDPANEPELPEGIAARRTGLALATPHPTDGTFEFLRTLTVVTSSYQRSRLRFALTNAYRPPAADAPAPSYRMARVLDLNQALSFFVDSPKAHVIPSRLTLEGTAMIGGVVTAISVAFDAQLRYFSVRTVESDPSAVRYYQLIVGADDRLEFVDAAPVTAEVANARLDLTHFAY